MPDCAKFTKWDRKSYYYPDLPKGYQISQYDSALELRRASRHPRPGERGSRTRRIGIIRAHLEEDAGKSMHDEVAGKADSRIDLNRTGTPLLEIVSEPDMRSAAKRRRTTSTELKLLLNYLDVSDCNMQEGSSAGRREHQPCTFHAADGKVATPIVEVKNMNSFPRGRAGVGLRGETGSGRSGRRQTGQKLGDVPKQTRGWDDQAAQVTRGQRYKEEVERLPLLPRPGPRPGDDAPDEVIEEIRSSLGELPAEVARIGCAEEHEITAYDADVLVNQGRAGRLLRGRGPAGCGRRQGGQQLDPARRSCGRSTKEQIGDRTSFPCRPRGSGRV